MRKVTIDSVTISKSLVPEMVLISVSDGHDMYMEDTIPAGDLLKALAIVLNKNIEVEDIE